MKKDPSEKQSTTHPSGLNSKMDYIQEGELRYKRAHNSEYLSPFGKALNSSQEALKKKKSFGICVITLQATHLISTYFSIRLTKDTHIVYLCGDAIPWRLDKKR